MPSYKIGKLYGRFVVTYRDRHGKRRRYRLVAANAVEAHRAAAEIFAELTYSKNGTVAELWNAYVEERAGRAIVVTMHHTWKALKDRFGSMSTSSITVQTCRDHTEARRAAGIKDGTICTELGHLRLVLRWAEKRDFITKSPYIELPSRPPPKDHFLTKHEARTLISRATMPHIRLYIILALSTGARNAALLDLTWDRCDFERGLIDLRNPDIERRHKGRAIVPMTNTARAALLGAQAGALTRYVIEWGGARVQSVKRALRASAQRAKLGSISPHVLRHSAAVHMIEDGVPMEEVGQFLGHSSLHITRQVYARFSPDYLRRAAASLEYEGLIEIAKVQAKR